MVSVNTEDGGLYSGKRIFAIPIPPVAVIVCSDITKDDDDVRFCELIAFPWYGSAPAAFVFLLSNDPIRHYSPDRGRLN